MINTLKNLKLTGILLIPVFICFKDSYSQINLEYQKPPKSFVDIIDNSVNRNIIISGRGNFLAILQEPSYSSIKDLSIPILKLAGVRFNPANHTNSSSAYYSDISIKNVNTLEEFKIIGIPNHAKIGHVTFSPDENRIAFVIKTENNLELYTSYLPTKETKRLTNFPLNDTYGKVYQWSSNGEVILAKFIQDNRKEIKNSNTPTGPTVMENLGETKPSRTYQDLLKNTKDEDLLDFHLISQLKMVYLNGQVVNFNKPSIYRNFDFSPDGNMVMIETIEKPYSYNVPLHLFGYNTEIFDKYGKLIRKLAKAPIADNLPSGFDAVIKGPRLYQWRADKPQTYIWVEAQDEGDPSQRISVRDIIYSQEANSQKAQKLTQCYLRFNSIIWGDDQIALVTERWFKTRGERRVFIKPSNQSYRVNLWDRYYENGYDDPGKFVTVKNEYNRDVLLLSYNPVRRIADPNNINIFSISEGASPRGNRPFLLQFNVKTKNTDTLFRSKAPYYERPLFYNNKDKFIISRESISEPTNYFALEITGKRGKQLTYFPNPNQELASISKQQLNYKRSDNINLSATLYLPKNYSTTQGKLPVLIWAYPKEYKTSAAANQVKGSPYQFSKINWSSPIYWVTQGFAVLDNADMPIVGESNDQPNDTFIQQLHSNATAAISKLTEMGIADSKRIAIGGHSYGAFMAANLLAHSNLFAAGIARSGAYNRSLTPFGFQSEERTLWENPELYNKMSPFNYADKIKAPLLLIHGEADNNSGTFPFQSERFYNALKGNGATTRLVFLPEESHSYKAKESVLHMLWEMDNWLKTYVKNK